jgi:enterochelin esterase family protein
VVRARVNSEFDTFLEAAAKASDKNAVIDAYLARQKAFPIIEETGRVHFLYRGNAKDVGIVGDMIGFRREDPMKRLADTDLFYYTTQLEPDAAVTYGFLVDYAKPIADPRNPRPGKGLFGDVSLLTMPAWREPGWLASAARGRQGRLEPLEFESHVREGRKCLTQVYLPADYDKQPAKRYPLLFVHDGQDALDQGSMKNALDQLVGVTVQPLIAVFMIPDPNDKELNQGQFDKYTEMLVTELIPKLDAKYRTIKEPSSRAAFGAADGANAALFSVLGHPETFGRLGAQSATIMTAAEYNKQLPGAEAQPMVTYLAWGTYDLRSPHEAWDMAKGNRELWALMRSKGYRPTGGEQPDGFGWIVWRAHLDKMLTALYPARQN